MKIEVFSGINIFNSLFFYLENFDNEAEFIFDLKETKYKKGNQIEIIYEKYGEMIDLFINCFRTIKLQLYFLIIQIFFLFSFVRTSTFIYNL